MENTAIKCIMLICWFSLEWRVYKKDMDSTEIELGHFNL